MQWDLQEIFVSDEAFYNSIDEAKKLLDDIKKYQNIKLDSNLLLSLLDEKWYIKKLSNKILLYGSLMYYKNIGDEKCIKLKETAEVFDSHVNTELKFIDKKIIDLGLKKVNSFISHNSKLNVYKLSIKNLFRLEKHVVTQKANQEIKNNNDIINNQINIYNNLLRDINYGNIIVNKENINITSANFSKYISSRDRKVRKQAYFSVNSAFENETDSFANVINIIYEKRINNAILEKYNSVLEKVLYEENINPKIIKRLIKSVHQNLPLIQKYLRIKADLLEINKPHLYDFGVPLDSNLKIKYSLEEAKTIILNALEPLGEHYTDVVKKLFNGHIDADLNESKHQSITFSWNTYSFLNFRGSYTDLKNLIHEIGHIVNYYLSQKSQPFIYEDSTIFVGETASIVNEILLNRYLYNTASKREEKIFYLSKEIENYFTSVFKQTMYTEFENDLYSIKSKTILTSEILCQRYYRIIKKYYGKNIIYDKIASVEWTRLGHLYRHSYYPYKYATGLIMASVVVDSLTNKKTLSTDDYIKFLSLGSSMYSLDLLKILNIDLLNTDIIDSGFNVLANDLEKLEKIIFFE